MTISIGLNIGLKLLQNRFYCKKKINYFSILFFRKIVKVKNKNALNDFTGR